MALNEERGTREDTTGSSYMTLSATWVLPPTKPLPFRSLDFTAPVFLKEKKK